MSQILQQSQQFFMEYDFLEWSLSLSSDAFSLMKLFIVVKSTKEILHSKWKYKYNYKLPYISKHSKGIRIQIQNHINQREETIEKTHVENEEMTHNQLDSSLIENNYFDVNLESNKAYSFGDDKDTSRSYKWYMCEDILKGYIPNNSFDIYDYLIVLFIWIPQLNFFIHTPDDHYYRIHNRVKSHSLHIKQSKETKSQKYMNFQSFHSNNHHKNEWFLFFFIYTLFWI